MKNLEQFFGFVRERQRIMLLRKSGAAPPWTEDEVLQKYRFCNVFREDDKTTVWFRENIRDHLSSSSRVLPATVAFRWFNLISTGERIKHILLEEGWNAQKVRAALRGKSPLVTGAYIIKTINGMDKLTGLCTVMDWANVSCAKILKRWQVEEKPTLQWMHEQLCNVEYLGRFMAYEVVTDLRHTYLLCEAPDIDTWASAGPGCARGLGWISSDHPDQFAYQTSSDQSIMLNMMRQLLAHSREARYWPTNWPAWEMREVEHTLCEYDKWRRGLRGERLKRKFSS